MASPEAFIASPSEELSGLTKPQLCELATHYELLITAQEKNLKETLFLAVKYQLQRKGVLKTDASKYFTHFERIATTLNWPREMWPLLLQCVFTGKAQEVLSALSIDQAKQYDVVKDSILHAYELVPEAYRQKFRNARRLEQRTFVEFAREKECLFDRWCTARNVQTREDLRQLVLFEDFKNCLPESVAVYLNATQSPRKNVDGVCFHEHWIRSIST